MKPTYAVVVTAAGRKSGRILSVRTASTAEALSHPVSTSSHPTRTRT